jgi:hypothetical protein
MTQIHGGLPNPGLQQLQRPQEPQNVQGGGQRQPVQGGQSHPALPSPEAALANAKQRFPDVDVNILKGTKAPLNRSETMTDQVSRRPMSKRPEVAPLLTGRGENSRVALMPAKGVHGQDKAAIIQGYVNEGEAVYARVINGGYAQVRQPDKHDVAVLMWFLHAQALVKAAESCDSKQNPPLFPEGGMLAADPHGRLEDFLTSADSYERSPAHLHGSRNMGRDYQPRGVDLRNVDTPNGLKTVMFARLPEKDGPVGGDGRVLFVKMEAHGCRGLTPRGSDTPREHETPAGVCKGVKRFFLNAKDLSSLCGSAVVLSLQRSGTTA